MFNLSTIWPITPWALMTPKACVSSLQLWIKRPSAWCPPTLESTRPKPKSSLPWQTSILFCIPHFSERSHHHPVLGVGFGVFPFCNFSLLAPPSSAAAQTLIYPRPGPCVSLFPVFHLQSVPLISAPSPSEVLPLPHAFSSEASVHTRTIQYSSH